MVKEIYIDTIISYNFKGVDIMDIAALSMAMSSSSASTAADMAVMKLAMDTGKENAAAQLETLQGMTDPNLGRVLDVRA